MSRRARIRPNRYETGFDEPPPTIVDVNDNYGPFTHRTKRNVPTLEEFTT